MSFIPKIDPLYWFLTAMLRMAIGTKGMRKLKTFELDFIHENTVKQQLVIWISALIVWKSWEAMFRADPLILAGVLAPFVMFGGGAWFFISFAAFPVHLVRSAYFVTGFMLVGLIPAFIALMILAYRTAGDLWPLLASVCFGILLAMLNYDYLDGLKAGKEDAERRMSRAAYLYYLKNGIVPEDVDKDIEEVSGRYASTE